MSVSGVLSCWTWRIYCRTIAQGEKHSVLQPKCETLSLKVTDQKTTDESKLREPEYVKCFYKAREFIRNLGRLLFRIHLGAFHSSYWYNFNVAPGKMVTLCVWGGGLMRSRIMIMTVLTIFVHIG